MEDNNIDKRIEKFLATEKIYHYTSFEAACKIVSSKRLKFGVANKTNDINEVHRRICIPVYTEKGAVEKEMSKYKHLSFSKDNSSRCGYDIPAMWGHYAEKGYGICLVFDKSKIQNRLDGDIQGEDVMYIEKFEDYLPMEEDIPKFFERDKKEIFFRKTNDWSYEQEWRILVRSEQATTYLPFGDSLMAIITDVVPDRDYGQCVFDSENVGLLNKIAPEIPILNYILWFGGSILVDREGNDWSTQKKWKFDFNML